VSRSDWLFGEKLDAALAEDADKVELRWPFQNNRDLEKQDWEGRAFIL
jgi:hypothetical protein